MTGYVRKDTSNNIADGNIINAADLDAEFDGVQDAFNASTGHKHDGTAGEGAPITAVGPTQDVTVSASLVAPKTTNTVDLGSSSLKFKDIYIVGTASLPTVNATTVDTTNIEVTNIKAKDGTASASIADSTGVISLTANPVLSGGTANGVAYLNGSKVLTTGSALTFDGTSLGVSQKTAAGLKITGFNSSYGASTQYFNGGATTNGFTVGQGYATGTDNIAFLYNAANAAMVFGVNNTEAMRLTSTGLGIGTSSPGTLLQVGSSTASATAKITLGKTTATTEATLPTIYCGSLLNAGAGLDAVIEAASSSGGVAIRTGGSTRVAVDASGNLGIGTSSPITQLHVVGGIYARSGTLPAPLTSATNSFSIGNTTNLVQFASNGTNAGEYGGFAFIGRKGDSSDALTRATIDSSGNLGLGVTPSVISTGRIFEIGSAGNQIAGFGNADVALVSGAYYNTGWKYPTTGSAGASFFEAYNGSFLWYLKAPASHNAGDLITFTQAMTLDASGNLGIGTSSPGEKLTVAGSISTRGGNSVLFYRGDNTRFGSIYADNDGLNIRQPLNDYIIFEKNDGTNLAILDAAGNLGLGVTPSAWTTPAIQAGSYASVHTNLNLGAAEFMSNAYRSASTTYNYINTNYATRYRQYDGAHTWWTAASGTANTQITFTQAMTLDASGNLGVGTTSPTTRLQVEGANTATDSSGNVRVGTTDSAAADKGGHLTFSGYYNGTSSATVFGSVAGRKENSTAGNTQGYLVFSTNSSGNTNTERARIDSSGNLLVGKTADSTTTNGVKVTPGDGATAHIFVANTTATSTAPCLYLNRQGATGAAVHFRQANTLVGDISVTASATSYNTSSDYRLKENIQPMTGALAKVAQLKPCTYNWKADGSAGEGFIAHELQAVVPQCVTGEKDAVDAEGKPVYQGIDTSFLVATLTAAIQELTARVAALESK